MPYTSRNAVPFTAKHRGGSGANTRNKDVTTTIRERYSYIKIEYRERLYIINGQVEAVSEKIETVVRVFDGGHHCHYSGITKDGYLKSCIKTHKMPINMD